MSELGIVTLPAESYHADPCPEPSLSRSIAHLICSKSPRHARAAHPRLNPDFTREHSETFDIGTAAHSLLLEGYDGIFLVDAPDWRTNAAKEARDDARAAGKLPLLEKHATAVHEMVAEAREQLAVMFDDATPLLPFTLGQPEPTVIWQEDGVYCRARLDWLREDLTAIDDYKTAANANPERWTRGALFDNGLDLQAAFYLRGVEAATGVRPKHFRWIVQEKAPPYALAVVTPGADVLAVGNAKFEYALRKWKHCLSTDTWPAYGTEVVEAELPPWADDAKWLVDDYREEAA